MELPDSFYWQPPMLREKGVSIYSIVYFWLYYAQIRQKKNGNATQILVEVSDYKYKPNMYNGVRKQKSPLKASFEPVFITKKYA